jgi:pilus assembly protein Flp/PilA
MKKVINYFNKLKTKRLMKYVGNEEGLVAIEYGLIAAGIAISIVAVVFLIGDELVILFNKVITALQTV